MATKISTNKKKNDKEAKRKESMQKNIRDSVDMLPLANGLKLAKIEELTQTNVIKAALSEIPCVIMECYTDAGALPTERSPGYVQHLRQEAQKILQHCEEVELELQQAVNNLGSNNQSPVLPEITVHIQLPASDNDEIVIFGVSKSIEAVLLGCRRVDVIGQSLSKLIHPDYYISLHKNLMELKKAMNPELEPYKCQIAALWGVRAGQNPKYFHVNLRGVIRPSPSQNGILQAELSAVERSMPQAKRQALEAYTSSSPTSMSILRARAASSQSLPTFVHSEITSYITIHSVVDMSIIWVDERITRVNLWEPVDVVGRDPYVFIDPQDHCRNQAVYNATLAMGRNSIVSYAFTRKSGDTIYQRSRSSGIIVTLYPTTNQPIQGFQLFTERISEAECYEDQMRAAIEFGLSLPGIEDTCSNPGASADNQPPIAPTFSVFDSPSSQSMESPDSSFSNSQFPSQYQEPNSIVSEMQSYDNQLQIAPMSSVCDSPISQSSEMESLDGSFSNSQSPSQYQEQNSIDSEVKWYDNQPSIAPLSTVCDSPISKWVEISMEIDRPTHLSSFGNSHSPYSPQEVSFGTEYNFNNASLDT